MASETKRLYRSRKNRMIRGLCGGLGEFLGVDPTIVRLITVLISIIGFLPVVAITYLILMLVVPEEAVENPPTSEINPN